MSNEIRNPIEIDEHDLDEVKGGGVLIGLLLPAVQKVREASAPAVVGPGGGPHVKVFD